MELDKSQPNKQSSKNLNTFVKAKSPEIKDNILNTKYITMYLEILDDIARNKIKLNEKTLLKNKSSKNNSNNWLSFSKVIIKSMPHEIAYKYCFFKAKSKVTGSLTQEAHKKKISIKDSIYLYVKSLKQMIKRNNNLANLMERRVSTRLSNNSKKSYMIQNTENTEESESDSEKQISIQLIK